MCDPVPVTLLSGVTVTGPGSSVDLGRSLSYHTVIVWFTGSPSNVAVTLEGSHDNSTWIAIASTSSSSTPQTASNPKAVRYLRANLTALTGGTAPAVTVTAASTEGS